MKPTINKLLHNNTMVLFDLILLLCLAAYGFITWKNNNPQNFDATRINLDAGDAEFEWSIDEISKYKQGQSQTGYLSISGWVFQQNLDTTSKTRIIVILQNTTTGKYYKIPTTMKNRSDVTKLYYDGYDYDHSGYTINVRYCKSISPDNTDYAIFLLINNKKGKTLIDTNITVNEWLTNHNSI